MAVAKARLLEPLEYITVPVTKTALVVGGGVTGMTAALALADQGFAGAPGRTQGPPGRQCPEAAHHLAGRPGGAPAGGVDRQSQKSPQHHHPLPLHRGARCPGWWATSAPPCPRNQVIDHGIVILAIGAEPHRPVGQYLYGENPNVLLSLDLDQELAEESDTAPEGPGRGLHSVRGLPHARRGPTAARSAAATPWRAP